MRLLFGFIALLFSAAMAIGQDAFPSRQITVIVPFSAGGSADVVGRVVAAGLKQKFGQTVIVDNRPGANGIIGTREVVQAKPDGYTLLIGNVGIPVISSAINSNFPFDPGQVLVPISNIAEFSIAMLVRPNLPVSSVEQFVKYAKEHPGKLNFGSSGVGTLAHLSAEVLMQRTGLTMQHIPYRSVSNMLTDIIGGSIDVLFAGSGLAVGQVQGGKLKALAVTSTYRLPQLPDVPTMQEAGIANFDITGWMGVFGPADLPQDIRAKLSTALVEQTRDPATRRDLQAVGFEPVGSDWQKFDAFYRAELRRWSDLVNERHLRK